VKAKPSAQESEREIAGRVFRDQQLQRSQIEDHVPGRHPTPRRRPQVGAGAGGFRAGAQFLRLRAHPFGVSRKICASFIGFAGSAAARLCY